MSPGQAVPTLLDLCTVSPSPTVYSCLSRPILNLDRITSMQASILKWESVSNASQNANSLVPPSSGSPSSSVRQVSGFEHPLFVVFCLWISEVASFPAWSILFCFLPPLQCLGYFLFIFASLLKVHPTAEPVLVSRLCSLGSQWLDSVTQLSDLVTFIFKQSCGSSTR